MSTKRCDKSHGIIGIEVDMDDESLVYVFNVKSVAVGRVYDVLREIVPTSSEKMSIAPHGKDSIALAILGPRATARDVRPILQALRGHDQIHPSLDPLLFGS